MMMKKIIIQCLSRLNFSKNTEMIPGYGGKRTNLKKLEKIMFLISELKGTTVKQQLLRTSKCRILKLK